MEQTTATSAPKYCCPRLSSDKVLQKEDIELLLIYPQAGFDPPFEQSDVEFTEWKTDALAN